MKTTNPTHSFHDGGRDIHESPTASFGNSFHAEESLVAYSLSRHCRINVYCVPIYTPPTTSATIAHPVPRSKRAKGPHGEFGVLPGPPGPGEGSSSPKCVYLGNFRMGIVCND